MALNEMKNTGKKILIIEDEKHIAEAIKLNLRMIGHEVLHAINGLEGLNFFKEFNMAKVNTSDAFLTTKIKNDKEIETATAKNISRVTPSDIQEIHQNLMRILNIKSEDESKYFSLDNFKNLVVKIKQEKKVNEEYKNYKLQNGEKALKKEEWLTQKSKS